MTIVKPVSPELSPKLRKSSLPVDPSGGETFKFQEKLPKLPIPELEITAEKYLAALKPLQVSHIQKSIHITSLLTLFLRHLRNIKSPSLPCMNF